MHDLLIRGGTVVDGTGAPGRTADIAITDGVITDIGTVDGLARGPRRERAVGHARFRRRPHSLRRSDHGPAADTDLLARRHHHRDGQLRSGVRPSSGTVTTGSSA